MAIAQWEDSSAIPMAVTAGRLSAYLGLLKLWESSPREEGSFTQILSSGTRLRRLHGLLSQA